MIKTLGVEADQTLRCDEHGPVEWQRDIVCAECGRIYLANDQGNLEAPAKCACGVQLAPVPGRAFSARAVCRRCALDSKEPRP